MKTIPVALMAIAITACDQRPNSADQHSIDAEKHQHAQEIARIKLEISSLKETLSMVETKVGRAGLQSKYLQESIAKFDLTDWKSVVPDVKRSAEALDSDIKDAEATLKVR